MAKVVNSPSRIRREIASSLPTNLGESCLRLGTIRRRIQEEDHLAHLTAAGDLDNEEEIDQSSTFNKLITEADLDAAKSRRMRWLSQICEYWPLRRLASITDADVESVLNSYATNPSNSTPLDTSTLDSRIARLPQIILAGSGPGHPDLLTRATHKAILTADIILADKLVPSGVLDLIPRRTPIHIARKFPGNAELAQQELLSLGLAGLKAGKTVLRLKQGDPYIYGRGGEEFEFFRKEGYGDRVVIKGLVADLTTHDSEDAKVVDENGQVDQSRKLWPLSTPCAVIERASCPDQRVVRTSLEWVVDAIEEVGSRPPGLLVLGAACEVLFNQNASKDGRKWVVEEGFKGLDELSLGEAGLGVHNGDGERPDVVRGDSFGRELKV
ncbi:hypothetical protein EYC84_010552 [Monilinia fructicola]|uniref:Tetrapyrrole methylase domain-containing protein n=1 Tax=Monilinia fructicola TaxID=38448 RepID=A0A5M9J8A9_MONFR|nr:hypothetical protein EYC84_010552 [Monilinia fructicola]